jgi:hypothetical protein
MVSTGTGSRVVPPSSEVRVRCSGGSVTGMSRKPGAFFAGRGRTAAGVRVAAAEGRRAEGLVLVVFAREVFAREEVFARDDVFARDVLPREDFALDAVARELFALETLPFARREAVFDAFFFGRARAAEAFAVPRFDFADLLFFLAAISDSPVVST